MLAFRTKVPSPVPSPETEGFWQAAAEGRFLLRHCRACDWPHWYPRAICPFCDSPDGEWREASGRGIVYSYSVMRRAAEPYAIAYVTLAEGPTMLTNLVACDPDAIRIGMAVAVAFQPTEDGPPLPVFRPV